MELDSFVHIASHDLRAPLQVIASFSDLLNEHYKEKLDDKGRSWLNTIKRNTGRMNELINDLLTLSKITRVKNPYEEVDSNVLIQELLEFLRTTIAQNHAHVRVQPDLPKLHCDRIKIREVFFNLLNNALKFSSKSDDKNIEVGCTENDDQVEFFVKDHGIGIEAEYHEKIFEIFNRLHPDAEYEGTGVGLYIVKKIAEEHHGKVRVESKPGEGSTFYFSIPKKLETRQPAKEPEIMPTL
jgi:two-component system sensor histidine kinase/response regulator